MRAAFSSQDSPDVLQTIDVDDQQASVGQVRVRVIAAVVQPADCAVCGG